MSGDRERDAASADDASLEATRVGAPRFASSSAPAAFGVGDVVAGKYRIDSKRGRGGMGTVFEGFHLGLARKVAIKVMHAELFEAEAMRRFVREARAAASLTSPNAVRVLDIDTLPNEIPFLVMEHLEGRDLHEVILEDGPLPWRSAVDAVVMAAAAISEAHAHGIIHRDLKPHNLFLTRDGVVKVLDFGLAKLLPTSILEATEQTKGHAVIGSPQYMAPEQIRAASTVDARTDVYGLGATLYQLLTGLAPFLGLNVFVLCARILNEPAPSLVGSRREVPPRLAEIVARCLEKDPEARYPSVAALALALRDVEPTIPAPGDTEPTLGATIQVELPPVEPAPNTIAEPSRTFGEGTVRIAREETFDPDVARGGERDRERERER